MQAVLVDNDFDSVGNKKSIEELRHEMVRFGKAKDGRRKNTLFTVRLGDVIFFGVARTHSKLDKFDKVFGKLLASDRCSLAMKSFQGKFSCLDTMRKTGLRKCGVVQKQDVKVLLDLFKRLK